MASGHREESFVKNAAILSVAGILIKLMGMIYRIPLYRLISDEGIGLYQMGYSVYVALLAVSVTGIPVAISKLVSEEVSRHRYGEAQRVFRVAIFMLTVLGFSTTIVLILGARYIANEIIKQPLAVYPLIAVAPAIFFVSLMGGFRGYFQGLQRMVPSALSQVVEQLGRIITVLVLAYILVGRGASEEYTAAAASFGPVVGGMLGLLAISVVYLRNRSRILNNVRRYPAVSSRSNKEIAVRILKFAIPVILGAMVLPMVNFIDTALVPRRLQEAGFTSEQARGLYGQLTGAAVPLINVPAMLAYALAASLVPSISEAVAQNRRRLVQSRCALAVKLILLIGLPAGIGLHVLAIPIAQMLYNDPQAGISLSVMGFAAIFLTLHQTATGILQGLGYTTIPVRNLAIGGICKVIANYNLTAIPALNIRGAALGSVIAFAVSSSLNIYSVRKYTRMPIRFSDMVIKPVAAVTLMGWSVSKSYHLLLSGISGLKLPVSANTVATLAAITVGAVVYGLALLVLRTFSRRELEMIPVVGPILIPLAAKFRLLRGE